MDDSNGFLMLNQHCIPVIKSQWWFLHALLNVPKYISFRIFAEVFFNEIDLWFSFLPVCWWFWYHGCAGCIKWFSKYSLLFCFLEELLWDWHCLYLECRDTWQWSPKSSQSGIFFVARFLTSYSALLMVIDFLSYKTPKYCSGCLPKVLICYLLLQ